MTSGRPQPVTADRPDGVGRCSTADRGRPLVVLASSPTDRGTADSRVRCAQQGQGMTWWHVARWDFVGSVAAPYAAARSVSPDAVAKWDCFARQLCCVAGGSVTLSMVHCHSWVETSSFPAPAGLCCSSRTEPMQPDLDACGSR